MQAVGRPGKGMAAVGYSVAGFLGVGGGAGADLRADHAGAETAVWAEGDRRLLALLCGRRGDERRDELPGRRALHSPLRLSIASR